MSYDEKDNEIAFLRKQMEGYRREIEYRNDVLKSLQREFEKKMYCEKCRKLIDLRK